MMSSVSVKTQIETKSFRQDFKFYLSSMGLDQYFWADDICGKTELGDLFILFKLDKEEILNGNLRELKVAGLALVYEQKNSSQLCYWLEDKKYKTAELGALLSTNASEAIDKKLALYCLRVSMKNPPEKDQLHKLSGLTDTFGENGDRKSKTKGDPLFAFLNILGVVLDPSIEKAPLKNNEIAQAFWDEAGLVPAKKGGAEPEAEPEAELEAKSEPDTNGKHDDVNEVIEEKEVAPIAPASGTVEATDASESVELPAVSAVSETIEPHKDAAVESTKATTEISPATTEAAIEFTPAGSELVSNEVAGENRQQEKQEANPFADLGIDSFAESETPKENPFSVKDETVDDLFGAASYAAKTGESTRSLPDPFADDPFSENPFSTKDKAEPENKSKVSNPFADDSKSPFDDPFISKVDESERAAVLPPPIEENAPLTKQDGESIDEVKKDEAGFSDNPFSKVDSDDNPFAMLDKPEIDPFSDPFADRSSNPFLTPEKPAIEPLRDVEKTNPEPIAPEKKEPSDTFADPFSEKELPSDLFIDFGEKEENKSEGTEPDSAPAMGESTTSPAIDEADALADLLSSAKSNELKAASEKQIEDTNVDDLFANATSDPFNELTEEPESKREPVEEKEPESKPEPVEEMEPESKPEPVEEKDPFSTFAGTEDLDSLFAEKKPVDTAPPIDQSTEDNPLTSMMMSRLGKLGYKVAKSSDDSEEIDSTQVSDEEAKPDDSSGETHRQPQSQIKKDSERSPDRVEDKEEAKPPVEPVAKPDKKTLSVESTLQRLEEQKKAAYSKMAAFTSVHEAVCTQGIASLQPESVKLDKNVNVEIKQRKDAVQTKLQFSSLESKNKLKETIAAYRKRIEEELKPALVSIEGITKELGVEEKFAAMQEAAEKMAATYAENLVQILDCNIGQALTELTGKELSTIKTWHKDQSENQYKNFEDTIEKIKQYSKKSQDALSSIAKDKIDNLQHLTDLEMEGLGLLEMQLQEEHDRSSRTAEMNLKRVCEKLLKERGLPFLAEQKAELRQALQDAIRNFSQQLEQCARENLGLLEAPRDENKSSMATIEKSVEDLKAAFERESARQVEEMLSNLAEHLDDKLNDFKELFSNSNEEDETPQKRVLRRVKHIRNIGLSIIGTLSENHEAESKKRIDETLKDWRARSQSASTTAVTDFNAEIAAFKKRRAESMKKLEDLLERVTQQAEDIAEELI